jgi:hypothetical protein
MQTHKLKFNENTPFVTLEQQNSLMHDIFIGTFLIITEIFGHLNNLQSSTRTDNARNELDNQTFSTRSNITQRHKITRAAVFVRGVQGYPHVLYIYCQTFKK